MQAQSRIDTGPEIALRRELSKLGLRYRLNSRPVPEFRRRVDVLFRKARVAVEVRGCFWHGCPRHGMIPAANADWWRQKLERTKQRDRETSLVLRRCGWAVIIVWEHDDAGVAAKKIATLVRRRTLRATPPRP